MKGILSADPYASETCMENQSQQLSLNPCKAAVLGGFKVRKTVVSR